MGNCRAAISTDQKIHVTNSDVMESKQLQSKSAQCNVHGAIFKRVCTKTCRTRSTGTVHTSAKTHLTSVVIRMRIRIITKI